MLIKGYSISMWYIYLLCGLCMLSAIIKCIGEVKEKLYLEVTSKTIASFLFIAVGILSAFIYPIKYSFIIIVGLIFGLLGDVSLSAGNSFLHDKATKRYFDTTGVVYFFLGHICYIVAMLDVNKFLFWLIPFMFILPIIFMVLANKGVVKTGKITLPMIIYFLALNVAVVVAINRVIINANISSILTLIASIIFVASDTMLGLKGFAPALATKKRLFAYTVILTYYPAQLMYAISILFL